ncbi:MAG: molybdopterin-binding protein [Slackia sp.]|nr:molybdopterin-binding protein [Slackia sp.]
MIAPVQGKVGQQVSLSGYADDFGTKIVAVEFSLDDGKTWARFSTEESNPDRMVRWTYSFVPRSVGTYRLKVRSVSEDGRVSPMAAAATIYVEE